MNNMLNLIGRLVRTPELENTSYGKPFSNITLAVQRNYKNSDDEYGVDFIDVTLWGSIAEKTVEYCHKGDMVGVKGTLQAKVFDNNDGNRVYKLEVVADKIMFLSSNR